MRRTAEASRKCDQPVLVLSGVEQSKCSAFRTLHTAHCEVHSAQCTVHSAQSTVHIALG